MMAYSSISHAGFILVGVQAATQRGTAAALFYLAAYTFMIGGTFGVITVVGGRGDERHSLRDYRGLGKQKPLLALALTILLLAQTGVPLTSGFFAKFGVIVAAVDAHSYWLALVAMVSAVVAAFVYLRIIVAMYMSGEQSEAHGTVEEADTIVEPSAHLAAIRVPATATVALALSVGVTIVVGILPGLVQHPSADAVPALVQARR
jgi:NADH-quinone oxidoreductase subunit N